MEKERLRGVIVFILAAFLSAEISEHTKVAPHIIESQFFIGSVEMDSNRIIEVSGTAGVISTSSSFSSSSTISSSTTILP